MRKYWILGASWACLMIAAACSSDTPLKALAEGCVINTDCASPLVCAFRKCHVACTTSRDCELGQRCVASDRPFHVCQLKEEEHCGYNSDCPAGQTCGVDQECRDQCRSDLDCLKEQICVGGTCAEVKELVDGGLPKSEVGDDAGSAGLSCLYNSECPEPLVCRNRLCSSECRASADCKSGFDCADNRCVAGSGTLIGPEGGVVTVADGKVRLSIPPGSLRAEVSILILPLEAWPAGVIGTAYQILPSGLRFSSPATLTFQYADAPGLQASMLRVGSAEGSTWTALLSTVSTDAKTVSAQLAHLSTYGVLSPSGPGVDGPGDASADTGSDGASRTDSAADASTASDGSGGAGGGPVVSRDRFGNPVSGGGNAAPSMSFDGRLVVYASAAPDIVAGDSGLPVDVFLVDTMTGTTEKLTPAAANGDSTNATISADGRYVSFLSLASNLVAGDNNKARDCFRLDRMTGTIIRVSLSETGAELLGGVFNEGPMISANGRYVIYSLPPVTMFGGPQRVARYDAMTGTVVYAAASSNDYPMAVADNGTMLIRRNLTAYWVSPELAFDVVAAKDVTGADFATRNINMTSDGARVVYSFMERFYSRAVGDPMGTLVYDSSPGFNGVISADGNKKLLRNANGVYVANIATMMTTPVDTKGAATDLQAFAISGDGAWVTAEATLTAGGTAVIRVPSP